METLKQPHPFNPQNPFFLLGVTTRELSYSHFIAHNLLQNPAFLDNLSAYLQLDTPLRFPHDHIKTEENVERSRLDIIAREGSNGRTLIIENKVLAQVDLNQQQTYLDLRLKDAPNPIFLAFKFVPLARREVVSGFQLLTSRDLLSLLPPGDHFGFREMLEVFVEIERRLEADPSSIQRRGPDSDDPLDRFTLTSLKTSYYEYLYQHFLQKFIAAAQLTQTHLPSEFSSTARGDKILQIYLPQWKRPQSGVQIHFEVLGREKIALHVETEPYRSPIPAHLERKGHLTEILERAIAEADLPELDLVSSKKGRQNHHSTTLANIKINFDDLDKSAYNFASVFTRLQPYIENSLSQFN